MLNLMHYSTNIALLEKFHNIYFLQHYYNIAVLYQAHSQGEFKRTPLPFFSILLKAVVTEPKVGAITSGLLNQQSRDTTR